VPAAAERVGREAAAARQHHERVTVSEPTDPRCLRPEINAMGPDQFKPILSFCIAMATDAVVNALKRRHISGLKGVADDIAPAGDHYSAAANAAVMATEDANAATRVDALLAAACDPCARPPPLTDGEAPADAESTLAAAKAKVTHEHRLDMACLLAQRFDMPMFSSLRKPVADILRMVCSAVEDFRLPKAGDRGDWSALQFGEEWLDPALTPDQLLERFRTQFPNASDDPMITGCFFTELSPCRPGPFSPGVKAEHGMCAKHYEVTRKFFAPGTFTKCCVCSHPKLVGFAVHDKREGPYALLNAIITRFALLPHFLIYDLGCGALRSAVGNLPVFVALVVIISNLLHMVIHVCSDIFNPRSYAPLDGKNTVAREQRNSPIAAMMKTLRACGKDEYMRTMKLHTILHNIHAHARGSCTYPLPEDYNVRQYYVSRQTCPCGCRQHEDARNFPSTPSSAASTPLASSNESTSSSSGKDGA